VSCSRSQKLYWRPSLAIAIVVGMSVLWAFTNPCVARADTPAITDFSKAHQVNLNVKSDVLSQALFITLYGDGRQQILLKLIPDDAVAGFTTGHSSWKLEPGLMWLIQMPVYVRQLSVQQSRIDEAPV